MAKQSLNAVLRATWRAGCSHDDGGDCFVGRERLLAMTDAPAMFAPKLNNTRGLTQLRAGHRS